MNESIIIWAVIASILLHILLAIVLPNFKFDAVKKIPNILSVELQRPTPPAPVVIPEPPKPAAEPIKKLVEPKLVAKPITKKVDAPSPVKQEYTPPPAVVESLPKVIAVEPKPDATPHEVVPAPIEMLEPEEKPQPIEAEPNDGDFNAAKDAFMDNLNNAIRSNLRYPKIALNRGISGKAKVKITFDKEGNITSTKVIESTGNPSLDAEAIAVVIRSNPKHYMSRVLFGRIESTNANILFTITNN